jgi:hypothetical protein
MTTAQPEVIEGDERHSAAHTGPSMKALVYHGPGKRAWEEHRRPEIRTRPTLLFGSLRRRSVERTSIS